MVWRLINRYNIKMLTKRDFLTLYDETVLGIRQIKNNNDKVNKSIGVLSQTALHKQTEAEKKMVEELFQKAEQSISKMQKNYLDPDTARKIGVVKQQLRIQRDRREQLLDNVDQITQQLKKKEKLIIREQQQLVSNNRQKSRNSPTKNSSIEMQPNEHLNFYKRSMITDVGDESTEGDNQKTQVNMEMSDYDLEIERKLMHEKSQQINHAHQRMMNIKNMVSQTSNMVYEQGEKLDVIGEDIFTSYKNVSLVNDQLQEANTNQKKSKRKYIVFSFLLLIIIGIVLFLIFGI